MKLVISKEDVMYHIRQLPLPKDLLKIQNISFDKDNTFVLDCGVKIWVGEIDLKIKGKITYLKNSLFLEILEGKVLGISITELVLKVVSKLPKEYNIELTPTNNIKFTLPTFLVNPRISTEGDFLLIFIDGIDFKKYGEFNERPS